MHAPNDRSRVPNVTLFGCFSTAGNVSPIPGISSLSIPTSADDDTFDSVRLVVALFQNVAPDPQNILRKAQEAHDTLPARVFLTVAVVKVEVSFGLAFGIQ